MLIRKYNPNEHSTEWTGQCDDCKQKFTHKDRVTVVMSSQPDQLSELMRKRGWRTRRGRMLGDPLQWVCLDCQRAEEKSA